MTVVRAGSCPRRGQRSTFSAMGIWFAGLLVLASCSDQRPPPTPGSFDRPTRIAFACFDLAIPSDPQPAPLAACERARDATAPTRFALHALVVQSSRGEVAAVDLTQGRTLDSRSDVPGYTFVPVGELPTAIVTPPADPDDPASAASAAITYVANAGSRDISVIRTRAFRLRSVDDEIAIQTVRLPDGVSGSPLDMVLSPDGDALYVSAPGSGTLLQLPICGRATASGGPAPDDADAGAEEPADAGGAEPAPDAGAPGACPRGLIDLAAIRELPLSDSLSRVTAPAGETPTVEPYKQLCEYRLPEYPSAEPPQLPADADQTAPSPAGLAIDAFCERGAGCTRRLLVADAALPLIHVLDLDALAAGGDAVRAPIVTGAPTRSVAVTPRVPVTPGDASELTQYVYAIDARDGTVLVTQDGHLLEVGASSTRRDRVSLGSGANTSVAVATSLAVLTPDFDPNGEGPFFAARENANGMLPADDGARPYCRDERHTNRTNRRLRGVFLAVGQSDGSVRIVDVHDMDLPNCRSCMQSGDDDPFFDPYPTIRHRVRIATTVPLGVAAAAISLAPEASAAFEVDAEAIPVRINGATSDPRLQGGLACIRCPEGQAEAFPDAQTRSELAELDAEMLQGSESASSSLGGCDMAGQARVCSLADPWGRLDRWAATYEGVIPGSRGGQGRFAEPATGAVEFSGELRFCSLGVLGSADAEEGRPGDQLTILGELPEAEVIEAVTPGDRGLLDRCRALVRRRDEEQRPIAFEIREAYDDRLIVAPRITGERGLDTELVDACFAKMLLSYQIRVSRSYVVVGENHAGFVHRVVRREDGRCVLDETQPQQRRGRAYPDVLFDNGLVSFQIVGPGTRDEPGNTPSIDTRFALGMVGNTTLSVMDATSALGAQSAVVPTDLRWSQADSRLYLVDVASRGVVPIDVDPFPLAVTTSLR